MYDRLNSGLLAVTNFCVRWVKKQCGRPFNEITKEMEKAQQTTRGTLLMD